MFSNCDLRAARTAPKTEVSRQEPPSDRFRLLTDAAPIGMFENDGHGECRYTNPALRAITGLSAQQALGHGWLRMVHPDDATTVQREWDAARAKAAPYTGRFRARMDGEIRWLDVSAVPTVQGARVVGWVGTLVDVTSDVEAERATNEARDRAVEASRLKSEFVANISHEIRTPLNAVLGLAEILSGTDLDEKQMSYVETLRRAGDDLLTLLNDILDLSKIEAGAMRLEPAPFDLVEAVKSTAELFAPSARSKGLDFGVDIAPDLRRHLVGDWARLRQVVSNLVSNAIKFTDNGRVTVHVSSTPHGENAAVRIAVEDTGPGILPEDQDRVFDVFGQADSSPTRRCRGSGLGLSISRQILDLMEGTLSLSSAVGQGSTFTIDVELATQSAAPQAPSAGRIAVAGGVRVLVVEDNTVNQLVLQTLLRQQGCEVDVADDGEAGVDSATATTYDLIFMDCQMPRKNGYQATAAIRALTGPRGAVPIVALTASAMPEDRQRCLDAGMDDYLSKPVNKADLTAVLERFAPAEARAS